MGNHSETRTKSVLEAALPAMATPWPPQFEWIFFKTWGGQGRDLPHWPPLGHLCFSVLATPGYRLPEIVICFPF